MDGLDFFMLAIALFSIFMGVIRNNNVHKIRLHFLDAYPLDVYHELPTYGRMMWHLDKWTVKQWKRWVESV